MKDSYFSVKPGAKGSEFYGGGNSQGLSDKGTKYQGPRDEGLSDQVPSTNYRATSVECTGNHPVITLLSPRNHPLLGSDGQVVTDRGEVLADRRGVLAERRGVLADRRGVVAMMRQKCMMWKYVAMLLAVLVLSVGNIGKVWGEKSVTATYSHSSTSFDPVTFTTNDYFSAMTIATTGTVGGGTRTGARCNLNGNTNTTITFTYTAKSSFEVTSFKLNSFVNSDKVQNSVITYYKNSETPTELSPAITFDKSSDSPSDKSSSTISESLNNGDVFTIKVSINNSTSTARQWYINTITLYLTTAASSCTAPSSVVISGDYAYLGGQTLSLTATPTGHTGTPTYQWQKEISSGNWQNISGATSATYSKSDIGYSDSGNYRCVVSTGATCSTTSSGYGVHVYSIKGGYVGEDWEHHDLIFQSGTTGTATIHLNAGSLYKFKVTSNNGYWYGNATADYNGDGNGDDGTDDGWYTLGSFSNWTFNEAGKNFRLYTGVEGDYTFTVDVENGMSGSVKVSVTYPTPVSHPAAGLAYFEKPSNWTNVYLYWYTGDNSRLTSWDGAPEITATTDICGTTYYYTPLGTTFGNVIFKGNGTNKWTSLSTTGCSGKYLDQTTYESPVWAEFPTYTVTTAASDADYGTVSAASVTGVACGTSISASTNTLSVGATNVTATPAAATDEYTYAFDHWAWTPAGATVTSDVTATANFTRTPKSYTLTWVTDGDALTGTYTSGSVAYGTPITQPGTPTKTGYTFAGWSSTPASTMPAANTIYTATWTANSYTISYYDGGATDNITFSGEHMPSKPTSHTYGTATTLKKASKSGYVFGGWYGNYSCSGDPITSYGATDITSDQKLYAKWTAMNLTPLANGTLYTASDMVPDGIEVTSTTQYWPGVSTNNIFNLLGTGSGTSGSKGTSMGSSTCTKKTIDGTDFTKALYFKTTSSLDGSSMPTTRTIQFKISEEGLLDIYCYKPTKIYLIKSGGSAVQLDASDTDEAKITKTVSAGTYYLYGTEDGTENKLYGLKFTPTYTVTLNDNGGNGDGSSSVIVTYNSATIASITNPTKDGYIFGGWYSEEGGTGSLVIDANGDLQASVDGYTGAGGIWTKTTATTLYAYWISNAVYDPDMSTEAKLTATLAAKFGEDDRWTLGTGLGVPAGDAAAYLTDSKYGLMFPRSGEGFTYDLGDETTIYKITLDIVAEKSNAGICSNWVEFANDEYEEVDHWEPTMEESDYAWDKQTLIQEFPTGLEGVRYIEVFGLGTSSFMGLTRFKVEYAPTKTEIVLDNQSATTAGTESVTATYGASTNLTSSITAPSKTGYVFGGYYTEEAGAGTQLIDANGAWLASKTDYTDGSKNWQFANPDLTLYAKWTPVSTSVNIEQFVLDNDANKNLSGQFTALKSALDAAHISYDLSSGCSIDTLNDEPNNEGVYKVQRNYPYLGLKIKSTGKYVQINLPKGKTLKVKFGNIAANLNVWIDEVEQEAFSKDDADKTYELASSGSNRIVKLVTSTDGAVVIKQIMIGEAIQSVTLPGKITTSSGGNGTITAPVNGAKVDVGSTVTITTSPSSGYELESLTVTRDTTDNPTVTVTSNQFTMPNGNVTINATFVRSGFTLTNVVNTVGYGTVSPTSVADIPSGTATSTSSNTYTVGGTTVTATPAATTAQYTYAFSSWSGLPATVTANATVTAVFTRSANSYTLAWDKNGGSTLTGDYTSGTTAYGTTLTHPDDPTRDGYTFTGWNSADDGSGDDYTGTMPAEDVTYYAQWEEIDYCYEFAPTLTSGSITDHDVVVTSTGGIMEKDGGTIDYTSTGLYFQSSSSSIVRIALPNNMTENTVITGTFTNGSDTKTGRGVKLCTTSSTTAVGDWKWSPSAENEIKTFTYTVTKNGTFDGTNVFRLIRQGNVYLTSLKVSNCGSAATSYNVSHSLTNVSFSSGIDAGTGAALAGGNYTAVFAANSGYDLPETITVSIGGSTKTVNTDYTWDSETGKLVIWGAKVTGNITITVTGVLTCTDPGLGFASPSLEIYTGESVSNTLTNTHNVEVSYSSSNEAVATVNSSGEVAIKGVGTTTITATAAAQTVSAVSYCADAASYDLTVNPYTITYNLNGGDWGGVSHKDTYTKFDDGYDLPTPTKTGYTFLGWYENSEFTGGRVYILPAGSTGNKTYYAKWGSAVTATWTITDNAGGDDAFYKGGGGHHVKAVLNQADWDASGSAGALDLSASEGVTLSSVTKGVYTSGDNNGKAYVEADFSISGDIDEDAIWFFLNVPAAGAYAAAELSEKQTLNDCPIEVGSPIGISIFKGTSDGDDTKTRDAVKYKQDTKWTDATTGFASTAQDVKDDLMDISSWSSSNMVVNGVTYVRGIENGGSDASKYYFKFEVPTGYTASFYVVYGKNGGSANFGLRTTASTPANDANSKWYAIASTGSKLYGATISDIPSGTYYLVSSSGSSVFGEITVTLTPTSGVPGVPTTLSWSGSLADKAKVDKRNVDADFAYTATPSTNTIGAITYTSSDESVATVDGNGKVHIIKKGETTITATLAESGCYTGDEITYDLNVKSTCVDARGTIVAADGSAIAGNSIEKGACETVTLKLTGYTNGASIQWQKDGEDISGANSAEYTVPEDGAGVYTAVTRKECDLTSNSVTVTSASSTIEPTIFADEFTVKSYRPFEYRLMQLNEGETCTVESTTSWIENHDFKITTEGNIVTIKGDKSIASDANETIRLKISNGCSYIYKDILIHATTKSAKPMIAWIATGDKGVKDNVLADQSTNTNLYKALEATDEYALTPRNCYWTTDEKELIKEYSQYDLVILTDYPNSRKGPNSEDDRSKSYTNALGLLIDRVPMLTFEAFVAGCPNWGLSSNPKNTSSTQNSLTLLCNANDIFGTSDAFNAGASVAVGTATEGQALQGFELDAMPNFVFIAKITDGGTDYVTCCERQVNTNARMMVFGLNQNLMNAITETGEDMVAGFVDYLLLDETASIPDCSVIFKGTGDTDWSNTSNWEGASLPNPYASVRIDAPCIVGDGETAKAGMIKIHTGSDGGYNYTGSLTIQPQGRMIVENGVYRVDGTNYATYLPTEPNNLVINANEDHTGALIFSNPRGNTQATVYLYSKATTSTSTCWQYVGIPFGSLSPAVSWFYNAWMMKYTTGTTTGDTELYSWEYINNYDVLNGFQGYALTQTAAKSYQLQGGLAPTTDKVLAVSNAGGNGWNLYANSWTAPIHIDKMEASDFVNADATIYLYNTGSAADWSGSTLDETGTSTTAGQYLAVPVGLAEYTGTKYIPSMQGFFVQGNHASAAGSVRLRYDAVVRDTTVMADLNTPLRTPSRETVNQEPEHVTMVVRGEKYTDVLHLFRSDEWSAGYENGYDAHKVEGDDYTPQLYAVTGKEELAVVATDEWEGTVLNFRAGSEDGEYTIFFRYNESEAEALYLYDLTTETYTRIENGGSYHFSTTDKETHPRFILTYNAPSVATGTGDVQRDDVQSTKARKVLLDNHVYIFRNGKLYDSTGKMVK